MTGLDVVAAVRTVAAGGSTLSPHATSLVLDRLRGSRNDHAAGLTERERRALGIEPLPKNLNDAIAIAEGSELLADTLGEHVFDFFLRNKRAEWDEYRGQVSAFERDRMLPVL